MALGDINATNQKVADKLNDFSADLDRIGAEMVSGGAGDVDLGNGSRIKKDNPGAGDLFALGRKTQSVEIAQQTITISPTAKDKMAQTAVREAKQG